MSNSRWPFGLNPTPEQELELAKRYTPVKKTEEIPPSYLAWPREISFWGNDKYGNCVTAEEAFAKITAPPYVYIDDFAVIDWAKAHGFLEGAYCTAVMDKMEQVGIELPGQIVFNGPHSSVEPNYRLLDFSDSLAIQEAIFANGPLKVEVDATKFQDNMNGFVTPGLSGWALYNYPPLKNYNHAISICGYGKLSDLVSLFNKNGVCADLPGGMPSDMCYAVFTWGSIGIIDEQSLKNMTHAIWVRSPVTETRYFRKARAFNLYNDGAFVVDIHALYRNPEAKDYKEHANYDNFPIGQSRTMELSKCPDIGKGFLVQLKVWVAWGDDNTVSTVFQYDPEGATIQYKISGSTLNNSVEEI